jgi:hypothetical protein
LGSLKTNAGPKPKTRVRSANPEKKSPYIQQMQAYGANPSKEVHKLY